MKPLLTLILLLVFNLPSRATNFVVTSNADSGPGTFRDALQQAAANGAAAPDQITFNLADISTAGRTIILLSSLPDLSSNLTIDGTTQPGTPFGVSNARVIIENQMTITFPSFFEAIGLSHVSIFGLYILGNGNYVESGLHFRETSFLQFGGSNKGNVVNGLSAAIYCDQLYIQEPISSDITIQGNITGMDPSGTNNGNGPGIYTTLSFFNTANLQIGGLNPGEGNHMVEQAINLGYNCTTTNDFGYLNYQGNTDGTDVSGLINQAGNDFGCSIKGYIVGPDSSKQSVNISNNISVAGFQLEAISKPIRIQGNRLGVGADNTTNIATPGGYTFLLSFQDCPQALVGGPTLTDKNYIANKYFGVLAYGSENITISQNSFFCNGTGINLTWPEGSRPEPFCNITLLTTGLVGGAALPNSTIELFYDDECPGCEGKTYIGSTTADNNGNWSYSLAATGAIVATATDTYGATSAFSSATLNTDSVLVKNATCGRTNGSIKNVKVSSGTEWYWKDANGNIVSTSTDLINVGPGTYTFVTSIGGAACSASSTPYTISNVNPPVVNPGDISVTQPGCGQANGAFQNVGAFDTSAVYIWLRNGGTEVSPDFSATNPLTNLPPGSYTLLVGLNQDRNCFTDNGPYILTNQSGPSLDTTQVLITPSTCGSTDGSLTNITYQNTTGAVSLAWKDSAGDILSHDLNLVNVPAGLYRLALKDGGGCDTIFTPWYRIPDNGAISYDTSKMVITPANCTLPNGAITGIKATNAATFTWTVATGPSPTSAAIDITGLAAGAYQLNMTNAFGCHALTPPIVVPLIPNPAFDYSKLQTIDDTCNSGQGAVLTLAMADPSRGYTWAWFNGPQPAGNTPGQLDSLKAGTYSATVTDSYACAVTSIPFTIRDIEIAPDAPEISDQYIPRNTPATITVANPQKGTYELLDNSTPGAPVLTTSTTGVLQTPPVPRDETFFVQFIRGDCSSAVSAVNIKVFDSVKIFAPNAFTPGNGSNNRWRVLAQGPVNNIQIAVYDRYGQQVFAAASITQSWDGTTGGHPCSGTFAYLITGTDYYNHPFHLSGTVIVIR